MKTQMIKQLFLFCIAVTYTCSLVAQECKENFNKGEECRKKGNYPKAIDFYTRSRDCGDVKYKNKSAAMIREVSNLMNQKETVKNTPNSKKTEYIIVPSLIYLPPGTEEQTIKVESSGDWGIKGKKGIINVSKKNSKTLTVSSISENTSTKPIKSSVTIECGEVTKTITIEQDGIPEVLEYQSKYMNVPYTKGRYIVELNTNTKWTAKDADWYKVTPLNNDSTRMVITIDKNTKNEYRDGTVVVCSESGSTYDELEIHQYANESRIFSPIDSIIHLTAKGDTVYVPIISDNSDWTPSDRPSWCEPYKVNKNTLRVIVVPNNEYLPREGFVNFKSNDRVSGVWIKQDAFEMKPTTIKTLGGRDISFGLTAGYVMPFVNSTSSGTYTGSVINYSLGNSNEDVNYSSETGFTVGAIVDLRIHKNWYIKTGVDYTHLQYTNSFDANVVRAVNQGFNATYYGTFENTFKEKYKFDVISIPVLASYRFVFDKWNNLQVDLGPVVSFALSGKMSFDGNSRSGNLKLYNSFTGETGEASPMSNLYTGEMNLYDTKMANTSTSSYGGITRDFLKDKVAIAAPTTELVLDCA